MSGPQHWQRVGLGAPTAACRDCWKLLPVPSQALKVEQSCHSCMQAGHPPFLTVQAKIEKKEEITPDSTPLATAPRKTPSGLSSLPSIFSYPIECFIRPKEQFYGESEPDTKQYVENVVPGPGPPYSVPQYALAGYIPEMHSLAPPPPTLYAEPDPGAYGDAGPPYSDPLGADAGLVTEMQSLSLAPPPPTRFHSEWVKQSRSWETEVPAGESAN